MVGGRNGAGFQGLEVIVMARWFAGEWEQTWSSLTDQPRWTMEQVSQQRLVDAAVGAGDVDAAGNGAIGASQATSGRVGGSLVGLAFSQ